MAHAPLTLTLTLTLTLILSLGHVRAFVPINNRWRCLPETSGRCICTGSRPSMPPACTVVDVDASPTTALAPRSTDGIIFSYWSQLRNVAHTKGMHEDGLWGCQRIFVFLIQSAFQLLYVGVPESKEALSTMFQHVDANSDGQVTETEFHDWVSSALQSDQHAFVLDYKHSNDPVEFVLATTLAAAICAFQLASRFTDDIAVLQAALLAGGLLPLRFQDQKTDPYEMYLSSAFNSKPNANTLEGSSSINDNIAVAEFAKSALALEGLSALNLPSRKMLVMFMYEHAYTTKTGEIDSELFDTSAPLLGMVTDIDEHKAKWVRNELYRASASHPFMLAVSLALRVVRLQLSQYLPSYARHQLSLETIQCWAPLAFASTATKHLPELEQLSYSYLFPQSYGKMVSWYDVFKIHASAVLRRAAIAMRRVLSIDTELSSYVRECQLQTRVKDVTSMFKKMLKSGKSLKKMYDMLGVRIIVYTIADRTYVESTLQIEPADLDDDTITDEPSLMPVVSAWKGDMGTRIFTAQNTKTLEDHPDSDSEQSLEVQAVFKVYAALQQMHSEGWEELPSRFKDYVTKPKSSGYQSLHTTFQHKPSGVNVEIQIRSAAMHDRAENGPSSHNQYKALLLPPSDTATTLPILKDSPPISLH